MWWPSMYRASSSTWSFPIAYHSISISLMQSYAGYQRTGRSPPLPSPLQILILHLLHRNPSASPFPTVLLLLRLRHLPRKSLLFLQQPPSLIPNLRRRIHPHRSLPSSHPSSQPTTTHHPSHSIPPPLQPLHLLLPNQPPHPPPPLNLPPHHSRQEPDRLLPQIPDLRFCLIDHPAPPSPTLHSSHPAPLHWFRRQTQIRLPRALL